jgi:hypothetical protein
MHENGYYVSLKGCSRASDFSNPFFKNHCSLDELGKGLEKRDSLFKKGWVK